MKFKVLSGGQAGVDRAALDAAIAMGLDHGGWCPRGRRAEDGVIGAGYRLQETPLSEYGQRTEWNVRDSDATLIIVRNLQEAESSGTRLTLQFARRLGRPFWVQVLAKGDALPSVLEWLSQNRVRNLNVAGPRESKSPGIYLATFNFLRVVFRNVDVEPKRLNLARYCLAGNAERMPQKVGLRWIAPDATAITFTFQQMEDRVLRLARYFQDLVQDSDQNPVAGPPSRVLICLPHCPTFAVAFFAAVAGGQVAVPVSPYLTATEVLDLWRDCQPSMILTSRERNLDSQMVNHSKVVYLSELEEVSRQGRRGSYCDSQADDPAFLVYTSGTSQKAKGVLHAHRNIWGRKPMQDGWLAMQPDDRVLHAGKLNWTYTLGVGIMDPWTQGATSILYDGPNDPCAWLKIIEQFRITLFAAVPTLFRQILKYDDPKKYDLSSLRYCFCAGEPLPAHLYREWLEETGLELYEALGMSEISTYISSGPFAPVRVGSPGKPQPGRKVVILPRKTSSDGDPQPLVRGKVGLLAVHRSDPGLMLGYWGKRQEDFQTKRGQWFAGGDLASMDEDGYVWFHGRQDDVANVLGYRVSPHEVEGVLTGYAGIAEVACGAVEVKPDVVVLMAFIVSRDGVQLKETEILTWLEGRLAKYKIPRQIVLVSKLPRTANGKLLRRQLAELLDR